MAKDLIKINDVKEVNGMKFHEVEGGFGENKKSILAKEIASIHNRKLKKINELINNNRKRFKDNIDIVDLNKEEFAVLLKDRGIYTQNSINASNNIYILSERGYFKLLKIMKDDLAWQKYDELVNNYFKMREIIQEVETVVQTNGVLTEKEWSNIKKKSKYLTENIHSAKSTRDYIKGYDLMHLQDVINEIYEIAKPCRGEIRYEILDSAIKTLKEISSNYDYSNPLNTFIKTVANDGVIKLQSIYAEKLVRGNNNKDKRIDSLKNDIKTLKPISFDEMIRVDNYAISKNDLNGAAIDNITGKPKLINTPEYKGWKWYFKNAMDDANIKQLFSHIDWNKPVEISYAVTCHDNNDIGNFIDALQDVIQDYFQCDDKKFLVGTQLIVGIESDKMKRKTWLYFRNVEESNLYVNGVDA